MGRPRKITQESAAPDAAPEAVQDSGDPLADVPRSELPALLKEAKAAGDDALVALILARCAT